MKFDITVSVCSENTIWTGWMNQCAYAYLGIRVYVSGRCMFACSYGCEHMHVGAHV